MSDRRDVWSSSDSVELSAGVLKREGRRRRGGERGEGRREGRERVRGRPV